LTFGDIELEQYLCMVVGNDITSAGIVGSADRDVDYQSNDDCNFSAKRGIIELIAAGFGFQSCHVILLIYREAFLDLNGYRELAM
jgi:hypothetical protein